MSNIITARDPYIIAAEINFIKERTRDLVEKIVVEAEIEIGGKLCEAKSMVPHGEWGKWLLENVKYSQSTAENLMNIYKEYGSGQLRLGDTWRNSETFKKLTFTQHLELLKIPYEERQEFAEENHVEDMSTRQLQQAIRERDEARAEVEAANALVRDANQNVLNMQQQLSAAKSDEGAWQAQIDKLNAAKHLAETSEKNAVQKVGVLERQLKDAQKKQREIRAELKKAKENPTVPESMMEQLRKEAEAKAAEKAAGDIQKQLEEANAALAAAEEKNRNIEAQLVAAQKKSDPDMVECNVMAQKLRADFNSLLGWVKKIAVADKEKGERMLKFLKLLVKAWAEALGMEVSL